MNAQPAAISLTHAERAVVFGQAAAVRTAFAHLLGEIAELHRVVDQHLPSPVETLADERSMIAGLNDTVGELMNAVLHAPITPAVVWEIAYHDANEAGPWL